MKRSLPFMVLALALVLALLPLAPLASADPGSGSTVLTGTVEHAPAGNRVPFFNATVMAVDDNATIVDQNVTGEDGRFNLSVPDGSYTIEVQAEGYDCTSPSNTSVVVNGEASIELDDLFASRLFLEPVYTNVSGVITDDGEGVGMAEVRVFHNGVLLNSTVSNSSGHYSLEVRSGNHTLRVVADGYIDYEQQIDAPASGTLTVNVQMLPLSSYSLQGTVTIVQGPLANCVVTLSRVSSIPGPPLVFTQTSNSSGVFVFPAVLEGDYRMTVTRDGYSEFMNIYSNLSINNDTVLDYPVVMREAFGTISGLVFNGTFMISNAQLALLDSNGDVFATVITDSDGSYQFLNVPTGTYTLKVVRNGYQDSQTTVVVLASENTAVNFDLANIERNYLFGLDMPHSMMAVAIFLAGCLAIIAAGFRLRVGKEPDMLYLKEDEEGTEEEF
ncbi:MAG: collagen binding domain-containing protein [Candidatus Methanomethylophilaceae archaeon]